MILDFNLTDRERGHELYTLLNDRYAEDAYVRAEGIAIGKAKEFDRL